MHFCIKKSAKLCKLSLDLSKTVPKHIRNFSVLAKSNHQSKANSSNKFGSHNNCQRSRCSLFQTQHSSNSTKSLHITSKLQEEVTLTSDRYPGLERGPFSKLTQEDVAAFECICPGRVTGQTGCEELMGYNTDWLKTVRGQSQCLVRPKTTIEVAAVVKHCYDRGLAIVPQGGNTGLVGGSVPVFDEVILSTQLMNDVISLDPVSGTLVCQAGCVLETLDHHVQGHDLTMPLDLGAKGSCHIGGNLATNAGGIRMLRYGSLHGSVLGVEAVLPTGEVVDCLSTLRKDNTGYDIKQLFIGSEGTLGIITAVSILCPQRPHDVSVALLGSSSFNNVLSIFKSCKRHLGEVLSAFEFMDRESMELVKDNLKLSCPLESYPFYALVEVSGSNGSHDEEKLMTMLEHCLSENEAEDGTVATDGGKISHIWNLRESCGEALVHDGYVYQYDVSLPLSHFYTLVEDMRERLRDHATRTVGFGHIGDGNLHLSVTTPSYCPTTMSLIEPFIYDWVAKHKGSVSAEHGLGFKKREFIYYSKSASAVNLMRTIKSAMDPKGIMNPYKVLPAQ